jgi:hypothetical protein
MSTNTVKKDNNPKDDKIAQLEKRVDQLETKLARFVPEDDEGEYTQEFLDKLAKSDRDIENGNVTEITSLEDLGTKNND